jgi:phosphatidylglycerophosphatase C
MTTDTSTRPVVAAFDVDGTLTRRDCVRPFLERVAGRRGIVGAVLRAPHRSVGAIVRRDRDRLKAVVVGGVFHGRRVEDVELLGDAFASSFVTSVVRPDTLERLRWHQSEGHRTVLVSASLRPYLDPFGRWLGVDGVLCTDVAVASRVPVGEAAADASAAAATPTEAGGSVYLDQLDGGNCRGPEKLRRLRSWMAGLGLTGAEVWAYGDSRGDRELLSAADHPVWVRDVEIGRVPTAGRRA